MTARYDARLGTGRGWLAGFAVLAAVLTVVAVSGCGIGESESSGDASTTRQPPGVDPDHPLALFRGQDLGLIDYAQLKLRNQCLAQAGYPQNLNVMLGGPRVVFENLIITPRSFGPTTEQEARRIGFGIDQPAEPPAVVSYDPNYISAMDDCTKRAWRQLGAGAQQAYLAYFDLGNKLSGPLMVTIASRLDAHLPAAMLACLRSEGYHTTDEQAFLKTLNPALFGVKFGDPDPGAGATWRPDKTSLEVQVGPAAPARRYQASAEEGALAVAWLRCRQQTGMAEQQMAVAVQVQTELLDKYEATFDELNPQIQKYAKRAATLIGVG